MANLIDNGVLMSVIYGGGGISEEAQAMLDNYELLGVALSGIERSFMIAYVDAEVESDNHDLKDYETIFSLAGANSLVDYIGGKVATAVNAPTHDINGYTFDGATQSINTGFNAANDAVNSANLNLQIGGFIKDFTGNPDNDGLWRSVGGGTFLTTQISNTRFRGRTNSGGNVNQDYTSITDNLIYGLKNKTLFQSYVLNGVSGSDLVATDVALPVGLYDVGRAATFGISTQSTFMVAAELADQAGHNTNVRALLTGLGLSI